MGKREIKQKCPCCDGKGKFTDEFYDEVVGCMTCNGRGMYESPFDYPGTDFLALPAEH